MDAADICWPCSRRVCVDRCGMDPCTTPVSSYGVFQVIAGVFLRIEALWSRKQLSSWNFICLFFYFDCVAVCLGPPVDPEVQKAAPWAFIFSSSQFLAASDLSCYDACNV